MFCLFLFGVAGNLLWCEQCEQLTARCCSFRNLSVNGSGRLLGDTKCAWHANGMESSRIILEWFVKMLYYFPISFFLQVILHDQPKARCQAGND